MFKFISLKISLQTHSVGLQLALQITIATITGAFLFLTILLDLLLTMPRFSLKIPRLFSSVNIRHWNLRQRNTSTHDEMI